ncbi:MAG: PEP-CTERM sorting domain-containing protein [Gammaproteobacteria bacterium]|nr:PEP-CTERM sorting domain-containing protein [Gammaproteobacteria bacterium]
MGDHSQMDNWFVLSTYTSNLVTGVDYYLHVWGIDIYGPSGFIGEFSLDSSDHTFVNGSTTLLTNTTDWKGNTTGWGTPYDTTLDDYGPNSTTTTWTSFGGVQGLTDHSAHWIWAGGGPIGDPSSDNAYFSTQISATTVPVPGAIWLFGSGLIGLIGFRRKSQQ